MSCVCQNCKRKFKVDFNLPDYLWKRITGEKLLCGLCIVEKLESLGYGAYFLQDLVNEDKSVYQQAMDENAKLRAQLAEVKSMNEALQACLNGSSKAVYTVEMYDELRKQLAEKDKKIEIIKSIADNLSYELKVMNRSFNSEHRIVELFRIRAENAEAGNAELRERLKGVEQTYHLYKFILSAESDMVESRVVNEFLEEVNKAVGK